jgi:hypothetical protein
MSYYYYDENTNSYRKSPFKVSLQDYNLSPATKTGRPLKADQIPEAIEDYLQAYDVLRQITPAIRAQHQQQQQQQQPRDLPAEVYGYQPSGRGGGGGGRGRGGGSSQRDSSGNCGIHSLWWWGNEILDTGTPPGGSNPAAPARLINMETIYRSNNLIFDRGTLYSVPAQNGIAQGQRKPVPCTTFNHQMGGFGGGDYYATTLNFRRIWQTTAWSFQQLEDMIQGAPLGFRGGGGGGEAGQRMIQAKIGGRSMKVALDTGTDAILGAGNGNKECSFDPNPQTISVPSTSHAQASYYYVPAWSISQRIKVCLTDEYTICQSLGQGGTIAYSAHGGQRTQGDPLNGKSWGEGNVQSPQAPPQKKGAPSYTQPIAAPESQQNQYFPNKRGQGYYYDYGGGYYYGY